MSNKTIYKTSALASSGRNGITSLADGRLSLLLATPGASKKGHNPEQLFALGYAACFDSAVKITARRMDLPLADSETKVTVALKQDHETYKLDVDIEVITNGLNQEQTDRLVAAAHTVCPYSNALRGNADVRVSAQLMAA